MGLGAIIFLVTLLLAIKRKIKARWVISLLLCCALLGGAGVFCFRYTASRTSGDYDYAYLALRCMEKGMTQKSSIYLKRSNADSDDFYYAASHILLERIQGNQTLADIQIDVLQDMKMDSEQEDLLEALEKAELQSLSRLCRTLIEMLPLREDELQKLEDRFQSESGNDYSENASEYGLQMRINCDIGENDVDQAMDDAIELIKKYPNAKNRLLLASVIAEQTYSGGHISSEDFAPEGKSVKDTESKESDSLRQQYEELERELNRLPQTDGDINSSTNKRARELEDQIDELRLMSKNIFAYRALNSIASDTSLEAEIVRAKIYYAVHQYDQAMEILCDAADSPQVVLSGDRSVQSALQMVKKVYRTDNSVETQGRDFRNSLEFLFGYAHPELMNFSASPIAQAFSEQIIEDQKSYNDRLFLVDIDTSQYPTVCAELAGKSTILGRIAQQNNIRVVDSQQNVSIDKIEYLTGTENFNSICFAVDNSGSMSGTAINDAKDALHNFLDLQNIRASMSLVRFESGAEILVPLTESAEQLKNGVDTLNGNGGTNICAGIREGIAALTGSVGSKTLVLMTDGQSSFDESVITEAIDQDVTIFTIGFGDVNDELLEYIAESCGGQYLRATDSSELSSVYSSLRNVIGNKVTITYTIQNPEETDRYFYLQDVESEMSVRGNYIVDPEKEQACEVFVSEKPIVQTIEYLDSRRDYSPDETFTVWLEGGNLKQVASASLGTDCTILSQDETYLELGVPVSLAGGVYALNLKLSDGTVLTFDEMLWIGNSLDSGYYYAGDLKLWSSKVVKMPDGRIVLSDPSIQDEPDDEKKLQTLSMQLKGVAAFSALADVDNLSLGETGSADLFGVLTMSSSDRAYTYSAVQTILSGRSLLEYNPEHSCVKVR